MKTYVISSDTNYGTWIQIINAANEDEAKKIADENGAWPGFYIQELDLTTPGQVFQSN